MFAKRPSKLKIIALKLMRRQAKQIVKRIVTLILIVIFSCKILMMMLMMISGKVSQIVRKLKLIMMKRCSSSNKGNRTVTFLLLVYNLNNLKSNQFKKHTCSNCSKSTILKIKQRRRITLVYYQVTDHSFP